MPVRLECEHTEWERLWLDTNRWLHDKIIVIIIMTKYQNKVCALTVSELKWSSV